VIPKIQLWTRKSEAASEDGTCSLSRSYPPIQTQFYSHSHSSKQSSSSSAEQFNVQQLFVGLPTAAGRNQ